MAAGVPGRALLLLLLSLLLLAVGQLAAEQSTGHDVYSGNLGGTARRLTQLGNSTGSNRTTTSDRTVRVDPLDNFRKYRGGYDITKKHYWSSLIFTGIYGYSIAVLWLLMGAVYGFYRVVAGCCAARGGRIKKAPCTTRRPRICSTVVVLLLTLFVLVASCVALAGSSRFHSSARSIKRIIGHVADNASGTISNITGAVTAMQFNPVAFTEMERITHLNATSLRLTQEAVKIKDKAEKSVRLIGKGLRILQTTTVVIVSLNMVIVLVLLGLRFLRLNRTLRVFMVVFWLMISFFWLFFGLYFFLGGFAIDTCTALEDYQLDPRNSSLSSILPCSDQSSGNSALRDTRAGIYNLINRVNANISAMQPSRTARQAPSGIICNPFSPPPHYNYNPDHCAENATKIGDIPKLLAGFACPGPEQGSKCGPGQFISADDFQTLTVYTASIQSLLDSFPGVESLVNCKLVKEAFSQILITQCRPLKRYSKMTWASMAAASTVMVLLALTWVATGCGVGDSDGADGGSSIIPRDHSPGRTPDRMEMAEKDGFSKPEP